MLIQDINGLLFSAISACFNWFDSVISSIGGAWPFIYSFLLIALTFQFILAPILGRALNIAAGSDTVNPKEYSQSATGRSAGKKSKNK